MTSLSAHPHPCEGDRQDKIDCSFLAPFTVSGVKKTAPTSIPSFSIQLSDQLISCAGKKKKAPCGAFRTLNIAEMDLCMNQ
jgi:hypothetical protein